MKKVLLKAFLLLLFIFASGQSAHAVRVGLEIDVKQAYFGTSSAGAVIDANTNKKVFSTEKMKPYPISAHGNTIAIKIGNKLYDLQTNYIKISPEKSSDFVATKNRWYRGELVVYNYNKKLTVINVLPIELYLLGVVPAEMPVSWNVEAHKAQAIAARSYAVANLNKHGSRSYDLLDTPQDQAYGGASAENKKTNQAVVDTRGIVLTYNGKVIPAYYHASSGGHTVASGAAWATNVPYLRSVKSYDDGVKKNGHGVGMSQHGANNLANKGYSAFDILKYFYNDVSFSKISVSD
ncbi:MAG: SpoIID/LytB domain-containing protein [Candidatus Gastranaerophilales bacterium]|nr:SpoIID/LytB domain-containing protein [Candidatus Gastranaerophilales bacterium]